MADEPERRIAGALMAELEEQATGRDGLYVGLPDPAGTVLVDGVIDLYLLARAVIKENQ